jgi:phosphinothricin acetyltransferase
MIAIRYLTTDDLPAVTRIYEHHALTGTATFDEAAPSLEEMRMKYEKVRAQGLPWLVAEADGAVIGYAYADRLRDRSAYRFTLEDSVYIDPAHYRRGAGRALLGELLARCEALGYRQMIAAIGDSDNSGSIGLHRALGFEQAGIYSNVGLKFGRWLDVVLMQRGLGEGAASLPDAPGSPRLSA